MDVVTQSGSLKCYLRSKYGEETQRTVNNFGKELKRAARYKNHHHFNLRCYKSDIAPSGVRIKPPVDTCRAKDAARRASKVFLQERIKVTARIQREVKENVDMLKETLTRQLTKEDFEKVETICTRTAEKCFRKCRDQQRTKFNQLNEKRQTRMESGGKLESRSWVVNLSDRKLTADEEALLSKGPKYALTPRVNPIDFAAPLETAMQYSEVSDQVKETARIKICEAIRKAKEPRQNISKKERQAWKDLQKDKSIRILRADKGNASVLMNASEYDEKVHDLLENKDAYTVLKSDPTRKNERKLLKELKDLRKSNKINQTVYDYIKPSEGSTKPALFYGTVKLHKPLTPLRPVVATRGSATYNLEKHLAKILRPLVGSSERYIKDTAHLVESLKDIKLVEDEILVSFDVKSLFTSIPVNETIEICRERLEKDETLEERTKMDVPTIIQLLRLCVNSTSFRYDNKHYRQLEGVAMGSPLSPVLADTFMEHFEEKALADEAIRPRIWKRFVDDVIAVIKKATKNELLRHLNAQHERIQFTDEEEKDQMFSFMDVRFTRLPNGDLQREVFRKPTHTERYVNYTSHQPTSVKSGIIHCLMNRATTVCSNETILKKEKKHIERAMQRNGYPRRFIKKWMAKYDKKKWRKDQDTSNETFEHAKIPFIDGLSQEVRRIARSAGIRCSFYAPSTTRSLYNVKDKLTPGATTHAVYEVTCETCKERYIGETLRAVEVRAKEHQDAIRLGNTQRSAIAEHVHNQPDCHVIDWKAVKVIDRARNLRERKIREAFHIDKEKPRMNRDKGLDKSDTWTAII